MLFCCQELDRRGLSMGVKNRMKEGPLLTALANTQRSDLCFIYDVQRKSFKD